METDPSPIVDFEFINNQVGNDEELALSLLHQFATENLDLIDKLAPLINQSDFDEAQKLVHSLKGVSGNLGIARVHNVSKVLDKELKAPSGVSLAELTELLRIELDSALALIHGKQPQTHAAQALSLDCLEEMLKELERAITEHELIDTSLLRSFTSGLPESVTHDTRDHLKQAVECFDYSQAQNILARVQKQLALEES